jgi:hypothetical protein
MVVVEAEEEWPALPATRRDIRAHRDKIQQGPRSSTRLEAAAGTAAVEAKAPRPAAYTGLDRGKPARDRNTIDLLQSTTSQSVGDATRDSSDLRARRRNHAWGNP